ncbi:uncharacterized protein LOC112905915 isoform X1 [Agrilus planipennis]|nr:uncharacterized protein LOC112905915 isoform X1 [Agrilus planipennis]
MCNKIRSEESSYKYVRKSLEDAISESSQQELDYIERQIRQVNGHCKQNEEGPIESGFLPDGHKQNIIRFFYFRENVSAVLEKIPEIQSEQSVDPLEAWSVKEITNMSKILSCKKDITTTLDK